MKFRLEVRYRDGEHTWWEDYEDDHIKTVEDAWTWADKTLAAYNAWAIEQDPPRDPREVVALEVVDADAQKEHLWERAAWTQTRNMGGGHMQTFDALQCGRCGITAKRMLPRMNVVLDSKWRAKCYQRCDTSQAHRREKGEIE